MQGLGRADAVLVVKLKLQESEAVEGNAMNGANGFDAAVGVTVS